MTVGTPLWAFVPRPNVLRIGIPVPPGWFPKEGPLPFLWSSEGSGGGIETPPEFFFGIVKGNSFNSERIPLDRQRAQAR